MDWNLPRAIAAICTFAASSCAYGAVLRPAFSFKYGGRTVTGCDTVQVDERLKVTVETKAYPRYNATEWVLWFENPSGEKSAVLSEIRDGSFLVSLPPAPPKFAGDVSVPGERAVITMNGCLSNDDYSMRDWVSAREFAPITRYFRPAAKVYEMRNYGARSSDGQAPFFEVAQGGQGAIIAIGWTGGWRARFEDGADGVRVETGLARARFYLEPGEKLRTSRVLVMNYAKGEDGPNKFRRLLRSHFSHVASRPGVREGLFAYELWGGLTSDEMIRRVKTLKEKGLAYEDLWIDAGWYGSSKKCDDAYTGDWHQWTGDWVPNARIHPKGLADVRDAAKDAGMGMMLWFEPERVVGSSNFAKEHPDMLVGNLLYYGNPRGREYVRDMISDFAARLGMSCYRQDFNFDPSGVMKGHDAKDREGVTEIRHITGLYRMWDELLARHPNMLIDNCASGGRRIDIESMRRAVPFFRSDYQCGFNANADVMQAHNAGLSRLVPYNGCTVKLSDVYSLRSAYSASHGVAYWNAIFQDEAKVDWSAAKKCCDEYRRIRKYFPCDFYNHGSAGLDPTAWAIWQYHDPEKNEGVVLAFRRMESPSRRASIVLKGLPKNGAMVAVENLDTGVKGSVPGVLEIELPEPRSSAVILYKVNHVPVLAGMTDRDPISYRKGEEMVFKLTATGGKTVRWTRTGDDGKTEKGEASADGPVVVKTSLDRPGFVRLVAELLDASDKAVARFDGGAGADVDAIRPDNPEPEDFDAFWARHKAALAKVPMNGAICREVASGRGDVKLYEVSVPCAGPRPATGFLSVPAKPGKYPAYIHFHGYNASWMKHARTTPKPGSLHADRLQLKLSAHGYEFNRDEEYYKNLRAACGSNGHDYAFDPVQNSDPEQAYFCGMTYRVMRGLEYLKSRPEWDGKTLVAEGGSQGGLQSIWAAALDQDVTECRPFIPWNCNIGGPAAGRAHGDWHIPWVPALGYYDAANMASRIPATCRVAVPWAGLGDYICPPSGVMAFYNNLRCPKSIKFVQGATHFSCPPMTPGAVSFRTSVRPAKGDVPFRANPI